MYLRIKNTTLFIWIVLMIIKHELLFEMISENPMIPYMIGTFCIAWFYSLLIELIVMIIISIAYYISKHRKGK